MTHDIIKLMYMYERDRVHAKATQSNDSKLWQDYRNIWKKSNVYYQGVKECLLQLYSYTLQKWPPQKCGRK